VLQRNTNASIISGPGLHARHVETDVKLSSPLWAGDIRVINSERLQVTYLSHRHSATDPRIQAYLVSYSYNSTFEISAGHVARIGKKGNAYRKLVGKPEGERPLLRPRRKWEDYTKMDRSEIGWAGTDWSHAAQGMDQWQALSTVMNLRVSQMLGNS
jgi:hypothetical protein